MWRYRSTKTDSKKSQYDPGCHTNNRDFALLVLLIGNYLERETISPVG